MDYDLTRVLYSPVQFSEFHVKTFLYQILCGIKYVHSADVIHRDLKPGNILVSSRGVLKICDFGLARAINFSHSSGSTHITNYVATRWYRAPELILKTANYGKPVDMWAVGCILCELYGRQPLMPGKSSMHQLNEIVKYLGTPSPELYAARTWSRYPESRKPVEWSSVYPFACRESFDLMSSLLRWDPSQRLTVEQALDHAFFAAIRDRSCEPSSKSVFVFGKEEEEKSVVQLHGLLKNEVAAIHAEKSRQVSV